MPFDMTLTELTPRVYATLRRLRHERRFAS